MTSYFSDFEPIVKGDLFEVHQCLGEAMGIFWARGIVATDLLWLPVVKATYPTATTSEFFRKISKEEQVSRMIAYDSLSRDLIIRLTALDDSDSRNPSFRNIMKKLRRTSIDQSVLGKLNGLRKENTRTLTPIRTEHRDRSVAHITTEQNTLSRYINEPVDLATPLMSCAKLLQAFTSEPLTYVYNLGSLWPDVDLFEYVSNLAPITKIS